MKRLLMKYISVVLIALTLIACIPINASAWFSDVPQNAAYTGALNRLASLGIIAGQDKFNPDSPLTREQFTKMIISAAGLDDLASSMKGPTIFPDISASSWSSGYINAAISKGYITGSVDGNFHPTQAITFAQLCTAVIKALGYTDQDLSGLWPNNYISKAGALGLTEGISLKNNDSVPRWAAAQIINRLLDTNIKKSSPTAADQTFISVSGNFTQCIVFGDSAILDTLTGSQVLTDKGTFGNPSGIKLDLGSKYNLSIVNGNITKAGRITSTLTKISVDAAAGGKISYTDNGSQESMVLPDNLTYYYNGVKQDFKNVPGLLQKDSSIVFNNNGNGIGYEFAVIFDPVYSKPEIAKSFNPYSGKLGSISFSGNPTIIRDGDFIEPSGIAENDVVCQVTDIWGTNKYILVLNKKVGGKITDVLPNRMSPKTIQIDSVNYDFGKDIDLGLFTNQSDLFAIGANIVVYLGYDGKIANVEHFGTEGSSDYALVLDTGMSSTTSDNGTTNTGYTAKLMFSNGLTAQYYVDVNPEGLKGLLVKYTFIDDQTVDLTRITYNYPNYSSINKEDRLIGDSYAQDNVKIFNVIEGDTGTISADVLKWSDLPSGSIDGGKILFTDTAGPFNDVSVILTDDILNQKYKIGIVKDVSIAPGKSGNSYSYTILIDGKEYKYNTYISDAKAGAAYKFEMSGSNIAAVTQNVDVSASSVSIDAIDSRRIKINNTIYFFKNNITVYYKSSAAAITVKTLADIDSDLSYSNVALYMDKGATVGSRVEAIVLTE